MWNVYVLLSNKDHRTYCGSTDNIDRRLREHNSGKVKSTRLRQPLVLIYSEKFRKEIDARKRERYLKSRSGRRELKRIFDNL